MDNIKIIAIDTDAEISKEHCDHIYKIYTEFYKDRGDGRKNTEDANDYIKRKEKELLKRLTNECPRNTIPYIIAPGPFLATREREPEWSNFYETVSPTCYYLKLTAKEVYKGLKRRRRDKKFDRIRNLPYFGCWDYDSITEFRNGKYIPLCPKIALKKIEGHMCEPCKKYEELSDKNRTFIVKDIRRNYKGSMDKLYNSIKSTLLS